VNHVSLPRRTRVTPYVYRYDRALLIGAMVALIGACAFAGIIDHQLRDSRELAASRLHTIAALEDLNAKKSSEIVSWRDKANKAADTCETLEAENDAIKGDLAEALRAQVNLDREVKRLKSQGTASGGWKSARVSWYGSAFYGHTMAGGGTYGPTVMGVAHKSLPFGTRVQITYNGRTVTVPVVDRGPYTPGRTFDLTYATAQALGFSGVGTVKWRIAS